MTDSLSNMGRVAWATGVLRSYARGTGRMDSEQPETMWVCRAATCDPCLVRIFEVYLAGSRIGRKVFGDGLDEADISCYCMGRRPPF